MKTQMDMTEVRQMVIQMKNLTDLDKEFTFYYDESNNIRKFYIKEDSFNNPFNLNFVLGGVVHEGKECNSNIKELMDGLKLQKSIIELKLKHIAKGDLLECLKSNKLNFFLNWLQESNLYVHFFSLNILYYSLVDIVDSVIMNFERHQELDEQYINLMKNDLYKISKIEIESLIKLFHKYEYPNIKKEKVIDFIDGLINIISPYEKVDELHLGIASLIQLLKQSKKTSDLPFVMDEEDFILLKDFSIFYITPIYMFKNSKHIYDQENHIEDIINNYDIILDGNILDTFQFVDSKDRKLIQISDVFIGILGKFTSYINTNNLGDLEKSISNMNSLQIKNFKLIHQLIDKSDKKNKAFLHSVESYEGQEKYRYISNIIN
jgi:hypothetical protein